MGITKGLGVIKEHHAHTSKGPTNINTDKRTDHKGKGVIKENPAKASTKNNANQKDGNNSNNSYSTNNPYKLSDCKGRKGTYFDNNLTVQQNLTNMSKKYDEILSMGSIKKPCSKNRWGRKINPDRKKGISRAWVLNTLSCHLTS